MGEISTAFEQRVEQSYQAAALEEVQTEHAQYFDALNSHPRTLVGQQVPAIGKEGMETLRDAADAKDWQDAVKHLLVDEIKSRASKQMEENDGFMATVHSSIELFQNNADLVPTTKQFDTELATRFTTLAEPYELRVEGKLQGYSIPVQPIINQIRAQLTTERAAAGSTSPMPPAEGAPAPAAGAAASTPAAPAVPAEPPQAGIPSKAGSGDQTEDFSTLFGTIGLPNLQI